MAERCSEARSRLAARLLTRSSFVLPCSRSPSDLLSSERRAARSPMQCAGQGRPSQLPRLLARSLARLGCPASVELPVRACGRGQGTLTGWVVRLFVVSHLLLSGRFRVPGGGKGPPTTIGRTARPSCFLGSGPVLSGGSVACLLLLAFNTVWLLHAGDPVPVQARVGSSSEVPPPRPGWPRSQACCSRKLASPPSGGVAGLSLSSPCRPAWSWRSSSAWLPRKPGPFRSPDSRLPEPALPPPSRLRASGWSVAALEARGLAPACLAAPSGATTRSLGDDLVPGAVAARSSKPSSEGAPGIVVVALADTSGRCRAGSGKPSSEGALDLAVLWKTLHPGLLRFPRKAGGEQGSVAQVQQWRLCLLAFAPRPPHEPRLGACFGRTQGVGLTAGQRPGRCSPFPRKGRALLRVGGQGIPRGELVPLPCGVDRV